MKQSLIRVAALVLTLPIFLGVGCAWQSDLDSLRREVSSLQSNIDKASTDSAANTKRALDTAAAAARTSEQAAQAARRATELSQQAVAAAQAANRKTERMFRTSLRK